MSNPEQTNTQPIEKEGEKKQMSLPAGFIEPPERRPSYSFDNADPPEYHDYDTRESSDMTKNKYATRQVDLFALLKQEYGLTEEILRNGGEIIEEAIVLHALTFNEENQKIFHNIKDIVTGAANWINGAPALANFMIVNYSKFTPEQIQTLATTYREKYPTAEIFTLSEFEKQIYEWTGAYATGTIRGEYKFTYAICFEMSNFRDLILKDLAPYLSNNVVVS